MLSAVGLLIVLLSLFLILLILLILILLIRHFLILQIFLCSCLPFQYARDFRIYPLA